MNMYPTEVFFCFEFEPLTSQAMSVCSLPVNESGQCLARDVMYTSATHAGRVHDDHRRMAALFAVFSRLPKTSLNKVDY